MKSWRWLVSVLLLVPMTLGLVVGFVLYPFVYGYTCAAELIDEHIGWVHQHRRAKQLKASMDKMARGAE